MVYTMKKSCLIIFTVRMSSDGIFFNELPGSKTVKNPQLLTNTGCAMNSNIFPENLKILWGNTARIYSAHETKQPCIV